MSNAKLARKNSRNWLSLAFFNLICGLGRGTNGHSMDSLASSLFPLSVEFFYSFFYFKPIKQRTYCNM